ncbi:KDO2-lipid IV(A) lauroyltransferase [Desulfuromusa kysingii]|uniref:KDO2-lipid IV(A) lauroyltransferase n=1 Tax=Desulfuromusa kysingii TaxID=37625 RepID=A0A1H3X026_9BACT|nr:lysophospholipid acyltransferase family protein [Desulfuromusa kysingii]SDZ92746.1 KDO2-lipid IV(A) lauroyltransferase [Desulfuromusa kysingii]
MASVSFKHRLEYLGLRLAAALIRPLPRKVALKVGRLLGRLGMKLLPGRYQQAKENMSKALPELSSAEIETNLRRCFEHFGMSSMEMLRFDLPASDPKAVRNHIDISGENHLKEALALDRGAILLTGHLGFWELGASIPTELGVPVDIVAKPLKNPLSDAYFEKIRKSFGANILSSRKGAKRILKSLRAKRSVGVLLDQHISPPGSVPTDFFGRKAYTTTAIANLAMKYQVPVVPIFCLRKPDDRYDVWIEPMLLLSADNGQSVESNTQLLTDIIEAAIRRDPSQWFWMHKRWRVKNKQVKGNASE